MTDPLAAWGVFVWLAMEGSRMPGALPIRTEHSAGELRRLARHERDGRVSTRLLALANALEGMPRERAAQLAGMTGQTLGDWVHRYNEEGLAGLKDRPRSGRPCGLDEGRQAALKALILKGPKLERDGCVAWRIRDLCRLVERRFGVVYSENGMLSLVKRLDLSWQKARPIHPETDLKAQARFKRAAPADPGDCRRTSRGQAGGAVVRG
jgi:transposase